MGPKARCKDESFPVIFANCLGVTDIWFKTFSILDFNLQIHTYGTVKIKFVVSVITPSHFSFAFGIKLLSTSIITNPAKVRSLLSKWAADLASSKARKAAILPSI